MQDVALPEQPLYARIVVRAESIHIFDNFFERTNKVKLSINGKHAWARKYLSKGSPTMKIKPIQSPYEQTTYLELQTSKLDNLGIPEKLRRGYATSLFIVQPSSTICSIKYGREIGGLVGLLKLLPKPILLGTFEHNLKCKVLTRRGYLPNFSRQRLSRYGLNRDLSDSNSAD
ncbi:hypothetical protein CR513_44676, partial [Mucuna pruriens]